VIHIDSTNVRAKDLIFFAGFDVVIGTELDLLTSQTINTYCRAGQRPYYAAGLHGVYGYIFADLITHDFVIEREKPNKATVLGPETLTRSVIDVQTKPEKVNGKVHELVTKRELYSPLEVVAISPLPAEVTNNLRASRRVPPLLTCLRALWQFEGLQLRYPTHTPDDLGLYTTLATELHKALGLPTETLKAEFLRSFLQNIGSELAPVAAVLGGLLSQDVINVLGAREQPLQNLLLFDGDETKGPILSIHPIPNLEDLEAAANGDAMGLIVDPTVGNMMGDAVIL
jgi:ubiquitin-like 1-activating enzyme E1 A